MMGVPEGTPSTGWPTSRSPMWMRPSRPRERWRHLLHPARTPRSADGLLTDPFGAVSRCTARSRRRERLRAAGSAGCRAVSRRSSAGSRQWVGRPVTSSGLPRAPPNRSAPSRSSQRRCTAAEAGAQLVLQVLAAPGQPMRCAWGRRGRVRVQVAVPLQVRTSSCMDCLACRRRAASSVTGRRPSVPHRASCRCAGRSRGGRAPPRRTARPCRDCTANWVSRRPARPAAGVRARSDRTG